MTSVKSLKTFLKNEIVLSISFVLAVVSAFFVHPSSKYFSYIDFRTLAILLSLMLIMAGLQQLKVFRQIGEGLVSRVSSTRGLAVVLVMLCFFFSMVITNDVSLITFVPFTIVVLSLADKKEYLIKIIVLETIAANLGSMATPIGNPQNLFLYSLAGMSLGQFFGLMGPFSLAALVLLLVAIFMLIKNEKVVPKDSSKYVRTRAEKAKIVMYVALFAVSLLVVARTLSYIVGLIICLALIIIFDRKIALKADYSLILTFICLFIFIGNMKQISAVKDYLSQVVTNNEVVTAVVTSQFISNVPSAILLSGFTENIRGLIVGTNLGGLGTLIASMASLISYKQYSFVDGADKKRYLGCFTLWNIIFLAVLLLIYFLM